MKNILLIVIISIVILIIGNVLSLPITVTLFAIFAVVSNFLKIGKKQKNKQANRKFQVEKDLGQDQNTEELDILKNLRKNIEKVREKNSEVYESQISYDNKIEEKKYSSTQEYYNKKLEALSKEEKDIKALSKEENVYDEGYNRNIISINQNKKRLLSNLSVEEAIIYSAILAPRRFNYHNMTKNGR